MSVLNVSFYVKKGVFSILLISGGKLISADTEKIHDKDILESSYLCTLYAFSASLRKVRAYLQDNKDCDNVIFESNNSVFINWVEQGYSKDNYQEKFIESLRLLNELPIRYAFVYNKKPKAYTYANKKVCNKIEISGLGV